MTVSRFASNSTGFRKQLLISRGFRCRFSREQLHAEFHALECRNLDDDHFGFTSASFAASFVEAVEALTVRVARWTRARLAPALTGARTLVARLR